MRKNINIMLVIVGLALLSLTSCVYEHISQGDSNYFTEGTAMDFSCSIHERSVSKATTTGFESGDAIGLYIADYQNGEPTELQSSGNHANNVKCTYNGSSWDVASKLYWLSAEPADAYSYYPYRETIEDVNAVSHAIEHRQDKDGGYEMSDFLWANHGGVSYKGSFYLEHRHLMSKIQISLIEGEGFAEGEWSTTDKAIAIASVKNNAVINLRSGEVNLDSSSELSTIIPLKSGEDWTCVVAPQTVIAREPLVQITIAGEMLTFSREEDTQYESGKQYSFALRVDKVIKGDYKFTLLNEGVSDWQSTTQSVRNPYTQSYIQVCVKEGDSLENAINEQGLKCEDIIALKISGNISQNDLYFIRDNMASLEALNVQDAILINGSMFIYNEGRWSILRGDGVLSEYAFRNLPLKYIEFSTSMTIIGNGSFENTCLCHDIIIPKSVTHIGDGAFYLNNYGYTNNNITGLSLPQSLVYIGEFAFRNASINHQLVLPPKIEYIGPGAFRNCNKIVGTLHIPQSLKEINSEAFRELRKVSGTLEIPSNVEIIDNYAFAQTGFSELVLNEGLLSIGTGAFSGIYGYEPYLMVDETSVFTGNLTIPHSVQTIGSYAFANTGFTHVSIPDNFEELPRNLFAYCRELQDTITIPSKVKYLGVEVFKQCEKISAVVLPEKLEGIGDHCFENCFNLDYIRCMSTTPPELVGSGHFDGVAKDNFTLVVPEGCVEAYQNAPGWCEFKRISEYRNFVCLPQKARLLNNSNVREVILNADGAWTVTHCPDWAHVSQSSGEKKTQLTITIDDLTRGAGDITDYIEFTLNEDGYTTRYDIEQIDSECEEDGQIVLQTASKGRGINIVFLGDGYDAKDIASGKYLEDMNQSMEYFFGVEPYRTYRDYFNVYTAFAMSYESGIGTVNTKRDVKFKTIGGDGGMRLTCNFDDVIFYAVDNTNVQESEIPSLTCVLIPNTEIYDGVTQMYPNGAAVALCPKSKSDYPYDARGLVQHEAGGHAFGKMADEYIYHQAWIQICTCYCCEHVAELQGMHELGWGYNMWLDGKYKAVPWAHMINDNRYNDIVDVYEGGYFHSRGVFRSEHNSCMNNNVPYFSSWSRELMVRRIKDLAGEPFSYEDFVSQDSREWGRDFTTKSMLPASSDGISAYPPREGNSPIISKSNPVRSK